MGDKLCCWWWFEDSLMWKTTMIPPWEKYEDDNNDHDYFLPRESWSSITSSNSWWNCINFFSSPNLQNIARFKCFQSQIFPNLVVLQSGFSVMMMTHLCDKWNWSLVFSLDFSAFSVIFSASLLSRKKSNYICFIAVFWKFGTKARPVHAQVEVAASQVDPHRLKVWILESG